MEHNLHVDLDGLLDHIGTEFIIAIEVYLLGDHFGDFNLVFLEAIELEDVLNNIIPVAVIDEFISVVENAADDSLNLLFIAIVDAPLKHTTAMLVSSNFVTFAHDFFVHEIDRGRVEVAQAFLDHVVPIAVHDEGYYMSFEFLEDQFYQFSVVFIIDVFNHLLDNSGSVGRVGHLNDVWNQYLDDLGELVMGGNFDYFLAQIIGELIIGVFFEVCDDPVKN